MSAKSPNPAIDVCANQCPPGEMIKYHKALKKRKFYSVMIRSEKSYKYLVEYPPEGSPEPAIYRIFHDYEHAQAYLLDTSDALDYDTDHFKIITLKKEDLEDLIGALDEITESFEGTEVVALATIYTDSILVIDIFWDSRYSHSN